MPHNKKRSNFAVLGLGRFGTSIVRTLAQYNVNILACDKDPSRLNMVNDSATHVVMVDVHDEMAMEKLGLGNFDVVIFAMGEDFEGTLMAMMVAKEQGAKHIVVKARTKRQKKILESMGADEVVLPEHEMGAKVARKLVSSNIMDILGDSELYSITEIRPEGEWLGKSLRQADIRRRYNLTVLGVRRGDKLTIPMSPDKPIMAEDVLIVLSEKK